MTPASDRQLSLVISTLDGGGGARAMVNLANGWAARGRRIRLISLTDPSTDFYALDPSIERIGLNARGASRGPLHAIKANVRRIRLLRQALRETEPEAIVTFMDRTNILTVIAATGLGVPVVVCEQIDPRAYPIPLVWDLLRLVTYRLADAVVVLSPDQVPWASRRWGGRRIHVIPNPAPAGSLSANIGAETSPAPGAAGTLESPTTGVVPAGRRVLLAVGRLDPQKGFDLLLTAVERVADHYPDWNLVILGEGPQRDSLVEMSRKLRIEDRVHLPGHVSNVGAWLDRADLFVLSSRFEGFPNALLEAMAAGLPVVSYDCPTGPAEIIRHGRDGVLVPPENIGALAAALWQLMADEEQRARLGSAAKQGVQRFSLEKILTRWDALLLGLR